MWCFRRVAAKTANRQPIALSLGQVQRHLGATLDDQPNRSALTAELVRQYLTALGCELTRADSGEAFAVKLPSWRLDLEREIDLVEEVARVYGYNRFADTLPTALPVTAHPLAAAERAVRTRLLALGYSEAISSSFASEADGAAFGSAARGTVALENPLSEEARLLRPSLAPGMIAMLAHNLNRDVREVRLFEQGTVFTGSAEVVTESPSLSLGLTGAAPASNLYPPADAPFFELKGVMESLLRLFDLGGAALTLSCRSSRMAGGRPLGDSRSGGQADRVLRRTGGDRTRNPQASPAGLPRRNRPRRALRAPAPPCHRA